MCVEEAGFKYRLLILVGNLLNVNDDKDKICEI